MVMKIKDGEYDPTLDMLPKEQEMMDIEPTPLLDEGMEGVGVIQTKPLPNKTNEIANRKSRVEWMRKDGKKLEAMDCNSLFITPDVLHVLNKGVMTKVDLYGMSHVTFYPAEKPIEELDWPPANNSIDPMP